MLETTAAWFPDKPFILFENDIITYGGFNRRAARLAGLLASLGAGPGTPVGLYLPSCPDIAIGYHACQKVGAVAVPISPAYRPQELERLAARTRMPVLICRRASLPIGQTIAGALRNVLPTIGLSLMQGDGGRRIISSPFER